MKMDGRAVANYMLDQDLELNPLQILKLVYIAHGWNLAIYDQPLIRNKIEAWEFGPVIPTLYHSVKKYGNNLVTSRIRWKETQPDLVPEQRALIEKILEVFGGFEPFQLSVLTHREGTPWHKIYYGQKWWGHFRQQIPNQMIREQFLRLAEKGKQE